MVKKTHKTWLSTVLIFSFLACSESNDITKARQLLNEKRYNEAIQTLTENGMPSDPTRLNLLAQAELGAGGFELLQTLRSILDQQTTVHWPALENITAHCTEEKLDLKAQDKMKPECVIERLLQTVHSLHDPWNKKGQHLLNANNIYQTHFSNLREQPLDLNFEYSVSSILATLVHLKSMTDHRFLERFRGYTNMTAEQQMELDHLLLRDSRAVVLNSFSTLKGLRFSYGRFQELIKTLDGKTILSINGLQLVLTPELDERGIWNYFKTVYQSYREEISASVQERTSDYLYWAIRNYAGGALRKHRNFLLGQMHFAGIHIGNAIMNSLDRFDSLLFGAAESTAHDKQKVLLSRVSQRFDSLGDSILNSWNSETSLPFRQWIAFNESWLNYGKFLLKQSEALVALSQEKEILEFLEIVQAELKNTHKEWPPKIPSFQSDIDAMKWIQEMIPTWVIAVHKVEAHSPSPTAVKWCLDVKDFVNQTIQWLDDKFPGNDKAPRTDLPVLHPEDFPLPYNLRNFRD